MVIALYGVAFAMVVGGLAALGQGYGIIMVERGWTLVIAGTIAAASGAILAAIAYGISRLALVQEELVRLREGLGRPDTSHAASVLAGEASGASLDPVLLDMDALTAAVAGSAPPAEPSETPSEIRPAPEPRPLDPTPLGSKPLESKPLEPVPGSEAAAPRAPSPPSPAAPEPPETSGPLRRVRTGLERSVLDGERREGREPAQPSPRAGVAAGLAAGLAAEAPPGEPAIFADEVAPAAPVEDPSDILVPVASDEPPVVIGTYDSGGNRYVMFSDGSIEAETPAGQFRFKSLDELKEFIAMGGENGAPQAAGARS